MDELDYYYRDILDGVSDAASVSSSDDDSDCQRLFDHGKHLSKEDKEVLLGGEEMHHEDSNLSFEREMENEARSHINGVHVSQSSAPVSNSTAVTVPSDDMLPVASTSKTRQQQNDELLYDPEEDQRHQEWLDNHRIQFTAPQPTSKSTGERTRKLQESLRLKPPHSDATLNCPCCLTLLCLDCQRHDMYKTQYRAMFVMNCRTEYSKKLLYRNKEEVKKKYKRGNKSRTEQPAEQSSTQPEPTSERDLYYPVHCSACNTQVALYDTDEVYHFFSVLASH